MTAGMYSTQVVGSIRSFVNSRQSTLRQHVWVALALAVITLAFFAGIDYGNSLGTDDWAHVYRACVTHSAEMVGRPFALTSLFILCPVFKADPELYHLALIGFRAASAFLLYLFVWRVSRRPLFAFACGALFSTFLVRDLFFVFTYLQQTDNVFSQMLVLLTLNIFVFGLQSQDGIRLQTIWSFASLALIVFVTLVREATIPLLLIIPVLVVLATRDFSRARLIKLALWIGGVFLAAARYGVGIVTGTASYSQGVFLDLDPIRMWYASKNQLDFAFRRVLQLTIADIYPFQWAALTVVGILVVAFIFLHRRFPSCIHTQPWYKSLAYYGGWSVGGILAAWLGFAAFLPTIYSSSPIRTHTLSLLGESVALASAIWLISHLAPRASWQAFVQIGGLVWVSAHGVLMANIAQQDMYGFAGTWDNSAYFFRSLANAVPAVKDETLLVYIENSATEETPFIAGWNFQYGIRYLYEDQATGMLPTDSVFGEWKVGDEGIWIKETWIDSPQTFAWNEIIFITRETSGRVYILDTLPEKFLTAYRQSLYHPFDRIASAFIPPRIQETFPILSGPDWTASNSLLR